jgi:hypothetical protein
LHYYSLPKYRAVFKDLSRSEEKIGLPVAAKPGVKRKGMLSYRERRR